jgi:hypothetical protein
MGKHELIVPARFDAKDAVAGLRAIEESSHVAGDLGQAADAASAQFRKAHDSVRSALQEFSDLGRTLQQSTDPAVRPPAAGLAANDAGAGAEARLAPAEWLESRGELRNNLGARLGNPGANPTGAQAGRLPDGSSPLVKPNGILPRPGADLSDPLAEHDDRVTQAERDPSAAGGSWEQRSAAEVLTRAVEEASRRGFGGGPGPGDGMGRSEEAGTLAAVRSLPGSGRQGGAAAAEPGEFGRSQRMAPGALADYGEWRTADRAAGPDGIAAARRAGPAAADRAAGEPRRDIRDPRDEIEAWHGSGEMPDGFDPREGIRRARAPFPIAAPAGESLAQERAMQPMWRGAGIPSGGRDSEARIGGGATDAIERLLREQNDLIKQDIQRNASPPIAAPPPLRGGGIRM